MVRAAAIGPVTADKAVLITGVSSGMGEDAALFLNGLGYTVFGTVRNESDGERLRGGASSPDRMHPLLLDVTRDEQLAPALASVEETLGAGRGLHGVFSNAGIAAYTGELSCERCPLETQQRVMDTNFFGAVRVVQTFLPLVRRARGTIVFNSAMMAKTVLPFNAGYAASKFALEGFADSLRREVHAQGVRVVIIEPALVVTALDAKQDASRVPAGGLYPAQRPMTERFLAMQREHADNPRCSPRRVSELVALSLQTRHPRPRYRVGGGSAPIAALGRFPDRVQDRLFTTALSVLARRA